MIKKRHLATCTQQYSIFILNLGNEEEESRENLDFCWPQIKRPIADEEMVALVGRNYTLTSILFPPGYCTSSNHMSCKNALKRPLPITFLASASIKRLTSLHGLQASSVFRNVCFSTRSVWLSVRESIGLWYRRHVSKILPPHSCVLSCRPVANKRMKGSVCGGVKHVEKLVYAQKIWSNYQRRELQRGR